MGCSGFRRRKPAEGRVCRPVDQPCRDTCSDGSTANSGSDGSSANLCPANICPANIGPDTGFAPDSGSDLRGIS